MAFVDIASDQHARYDTHSHGDEGFASPGGMYPAQLGWSDLHPPGVKVLPKGSAPAGAGEINWEDTLGGRLALALERLEGLLYAVFGSRPAAIPDGNGGWIKRQWYDREHPRCLWGPETWEQRLITGPTGCNETGGCWDFQEGGKEYAALGESPPCCPMPAPTVPIRSRSGDPQFQFLSGAHDRTYFPLSSVARDQSDAPFDPEGSGWFGATRPGRQDGVGYLHKDGDAVTFTWTKPAAIPTPTTMQLWWQRRLPGSSWSGWDAITMTPAGDVYSATFEAQPHGTELRWYLRYFYNDPNPLNPDLTKFEPGGVAAPDDGQAYYLQWFTHYNPYAHGLPELLADYGGVDVRHGTDFYQFDGSESIQPELVNLVRWILAWLGGDCCGGEGDICAETENRCPIIHHNPRRRGDDDLCCIELPIRFRWSGSNVHPHYMTGGKGLVGGATPDPRPLHNHPQHEPDEDDVWGSAAARTTWRGITPLYYPDDPFDNPFYGGGYSWGVAPGTFQLMYKPNHLASAHVYARYPSWGLRPGDVIEAVHIEEIIGAINYLIDDGVWTQRDICTRRRQPGTAAGYPCGWSVADSTCPVFAGDCPTGCAGGGRAYDFDFYTCWQCCEPDPPCCGWREKLYAQCGQDPTGCDSYAHDLWIGFSPGCETPTCVPPPKPTWGQCVSDCRQEYCGISVTKQGSCAGGCETASLTVNCDSGAGSFCGSWGSLLQCGVADSYSCSRSIHGWSRWLCGPPQCEPGFDDQHGNLFIKQRRDHVWHPGLFIKATGTPGYEGNGNCWGDVFVCGAVVPDAPDVQLWFGTVVGSTWLGVARPWLDGCASISFAGGEPEGGVPSCIECPGPNTTPPEIPGYGLHDPVSGAHVCVRKVLSDGGETADDWACNCQYTTCGDYAWVAVDLNLDGAGRAYRNFAGRLGDLDPYEGRGVPRLRDYDLTKDPTVWMHDCPCETWTGASECVI